MRSEGSLHFGKPRRAVGASLLTLLAAGVLMAATPILAQTAATPQPRSGPASQGSIIPTPAPAAPSIPTASPAASGAQPGALHTNKPIFEKEPPPDRASTTQGNNPDGGSPGGQKILRLINNSETDRTAKGETQPTPQYQNNPIPGIDVVVKKKPTGGTSIPNAKTDGTGQAAFSQLEPGNYEVTLPAIPGGAQLRMTTFVNGKLASRTDFPAGSSVGTFAVGSARDSIVLKFESNIGLEPVRGVGGTGGGRLTFKPNSK